LPAVIRYQSRRSTGSEDESWAPYVKRRYCVEPRQHALVIGCGNGWVERAMIDLGLVASVDAFDIDPASTARAEHERGDRDINYFVSDFKSFIPRRTYDLIVNFAALHHAEYLYRICDRLSDALTPDGIFFNWEYVGPNRNQYGPVQMSAMNAAQDQLPVRFRSPYPLRANLGHMVRDDKTEAVHSSEVVRAVGLYFDVIEHHELGGGIAYQILWNNIDEIEKDDEEATRWLAWLIEQDERALLDDEIPSSFAFFIAAKRQAPVPHVRRYLRYVKEPLRERFSTLTGGVYPHEIVSAALRHQLWKPRALIREGRYHARALLLRRRRQVQAR
jgi:SAM-dependent methyltransferase